MRNELRDSWPAGLFALALIATAFGFHWPVGKVVAWVALFALIPACLIRDAIVKRHDNG